MTHMYVALARFLEEVIGQPSSSVQCTQAIMITISYRSSNKNALCDFLISKLFL